MDVHKIKYNKYKLKYLSLKKELIYYKINKDLELLLNNNIRTELLAGADDNDIIREAQINNIDAILIEFNYVLHNQNDKVKKIADILYNYIIMNDYKKVIITIPHYCVIPKELDRNCDMYIDFFSKIIYEYLKDKQQFEIIYLDTSIPHNPRYYRDMNRYEGRNEPMRVKLRELLNDNIKTILFDIHSFPTGSFNEKEGTEIVLLQRIIKN
jgi:hypothetical protein